MRWLLALQLGTEPPNHPGGTIVAPVVPFEMSAAELEAWALFRTTNAPLARFLQTHDDNSRITAEQALAAVVRSGQARPTVAALYRLGQIYEEADRWAAAAASPLAAAPICPPDREYREKALDAYTEAIHHGYAARLHRDVVVQAAVQRATALDPDFWNALPTEQL